MDLKAGLLAILENISSNSLTGVKKTGNRDGMLLDGLYKAMLRWLSYASRDYLPRKWCQPQWDRLLLLVNN